MLDPGSDMLQQSSPTISSISSSDLDTESTGSFFHDRSTTLGTLMGVNFPAIPANVTSQIENTAGGSGNNIGSSGGKRKNKKGKRGSQKRVVVVAAAVEAARERHRRRWWKLCRDDEAKSASLGDFLEVERRFGDGAFYGATAELEGVVPAEGNGRLLFADGRVLPPLSQAERVEGPPSATSAGLRRFPVLLTGICSGGAG